MQMNKCLKVRTILTEKVGGFGIVIKSLPNFGPVDGSIAINTVLGKFNVFFRP